MIKVVSWRNDLVELLDLIYNEDYSFTELQDYFTYSFCLVRNLNSFQQILYDSIKNYLSVDFNYFIPPSK